MHSYKRYTLKVGYSNLKLIEETFQTRNTKLIFNLIVFKTLRTFFNISIGCFISGSHFQMIRLNKDPETSSH